MSSLSIDRSHYDSDSDFDGKRDAKYGSQDTYDNLSKRPLDDTGYSAFGEAGSETKEIKHF
jgi:hypothetical protein